MSTLRHHAQRTVLIVIAGLLSSLLFAPMVALADAGLGPGQSANVQTGGGDASLRSAPSYDAQVVSTVSDGTSITILESPVAGVDGSLWYSASANGTVGYIPADLVTGETSSTSPETPEETPESSDDPVAEGETESADIAAPSLPWQEPIDTGVVVDNDTDPLPSEGLACRVDARADAELVVRLALGNSLEVTGEEVWSEGVAFLPVNCAGVGGFVRADYVQLASEAAVAEEAEEVAAEEIVTEEAATEAVVTEEVAAEDPETEAVATGEAATEEPVTDVVVTEEVATDETAEAIATEEAATEAPVEEVVAEDVVTDEVATVESVEAVATEEGAAEEVAAEEAEATEEAVTEDTAFEDVATEETATDVVQAEGTPKAEAPAQEAVTEEVAAEEGASEDIVTEATPAEQGVVTEEPEASSEEATSEDIATETVATEAIIAEATPAEQVVTEEPEASTEEVAAEERATETAATEEAATEQAPVEEVTATAPARGTVESTESDVASDSIAAAATTPKSNQRVASEQQARSRVNPAQAIGTADVIGTNGEGVRCRTSASSNAATITILAEGTTVQILSVERNGYLGVICGGQAGFANVDFLYSGGAGDEIAATAGSVTVVGTGGGLNCRAGAGTSYGVLTVLRDGTTLSIRGASSNGWAPVVCGGQNGYVSIDYVEASGTASSSGGTGGDGSVSAAAATMVVRGTNGDGVRCRAGASTIASIITVLAEGTRVTTRGSAMGGWVPVVCGGTNGYVSATYLGASSGSTSGGTGTGVSSGWVKVTGTGGGGVRCRSTASLSGAVLMVVGEGRVMRGQGAASNGWQPVNCGGRNGFVSTQFIAPWSGSGSAPSPTPNPTPPPAASGMVSGDHAKVTDRLNLRYSASMGAGISTTIPTGTIIQITGGVTNGFYPVNWDGLKGFVSKDYVVKTTAALSERGGSGSPTAPTTPPTGTNGGTATGNAMVSFALRYEGYPYIWASHGPSGFDCSGFTYWVTKNVTGKDIGTGLWTQVSAGTPVSRANLQPGDLIFFQNTYKAGLSHSGLYIGNNRFIHAENETTGVRISDLNSTYYGSRWYGAVRMT